MSEKVIDAARLASGAELEISYEEAIKFERELGELMSLVKTLDGYSGNVPLDMRQEIEYSELRADVPEEFSTEDILLENAPCKEGRYIKVPKVIG